MNESEEKNHNVSDSNQFKKKSWNGKNKILMKFKADLSSDYIDKIKYLKHFQLHDQVQITTT